MGYASYQMSGRYLRFIFALALVIGGYLLGLERMGEKEKSIQDAQVEEEIQRLLRLKQAGRQSEAGWQSIVDEPLFPEVSREAAPKADWLALIREKVPKLTHDRGNFLPMISWECCTRDPLKPEDIQMLLDRGLTQFIRLEEKEIPTALALQKAGSPVIIMQGKIGIWPYPLAGDAKQWAHQYPEEVSENQPGEEASANPSEPGASQKSSRGDRPTPSEERPEKKWAGEPMPLHIQGWHKAADEFRRRLQVFKKAGVTLDAAWFDYENRPGGSPLAAALTSPSSRKSLPSEALKSDHHYYLYTRQLWSQLLSAYVAAPFREFYPEISITNWVITFSTPEFPAYSFTNRPHPTVGPTLFTASNPIAYAIDIFYLNTWDEAFPLDRDHVDQFYMHLMLRQVSADAFNRKKMAPYVKSYPWVGRWVPETGLRSAPVMSRRRYREALRHLWLRDVDGMQLFNSQRGANVDLAVYELQDAVAVFDEMLAYGEILEKGEAMNLHSPKMQQDTAFWSGKRYKDQAVVRVVNLGPKDDSVVLRPWRGFAIVLPVPREGATYQLRLNREAGHIQIIDQMRGEGSVSKNLSTETPTGSGLKPL
ncbi:MAG: hypothetical protein HQL53_10355 [Magnetococcales bacterium]|nr:hypothetical protein [Magnetococcales bacterium]